LKKRIVGLFAALLIAACLFGISSHAWMGPGVGVMTSSSSSSSSSSGGAWYYGTGATDGYLSHAGGYGVNTAAGDQWTPGVTKSITKIGTKLYAISSGNVVVSLWENVSGTWTRRGCCTITGGATGWNDCAIAPFSLTSSMEIIVRANSTVGAEWSIVNSGTTGGHFQLISYANECTSNTLTVTDDWQHGSRFWGE